MIIYPADTIKYASKVKWYFCHREQKCSREAACVLIVTTTWWEISILEDESVLCRLLQCRCRWPCVWIWRGGPKFMWRGTGADTHHYSEAPGSRMNIAHSPHPASPTDVVLAHQREGLPCFPSLIDSAGSPSIKSDRLSTSLNSAKQLLRNQRVRLNPRDKEQDLHLISHESANTKEPFP